MQIPGNLTGRWLQLALLVMLPAYGFSQSDWEQILFDDFTDGTAYKWILEEGWNIVHDDSNYFMAGEDHFWANCASGDHWTDYVFRCHVKLIQGYMHINFRISDQGRYMLGIGTEELYLTRDNDWGKYTPLEALPFTINPEQWYRIEVVANQKVVQVYLDDQLLIQVWDEQALTGGRIAFETLENSLFHIDNVEVMGPQQPPPPEGYDWIRTGGPPGGLGYDIRIHPQRTNEVLVTDNPSGINKSYDGGKTWYQRNEGITIRTGTSKEDIPIFSVTIDPGNPENVWCGTQNSRGIFKSEDAGESWIIKDNGVTEDGEISFRGFAIHPWNSDIVLAAAEITTEDQGITFNKTKGVIYKTTNGGNNWYPVWRGENLARVVLFDYLHPDTLYCSTGIFDREAYNSDGSAGIPGGVGILRSHDGGENWIPVNQGIDNLYTGYLEMHPVDPQVLYAASGSHTYHNGMGKIYKTTDGGDHWEELLDDGCFSVVTVSASNPDLVYAFNSGYCFRSYDGGQNWTSLYKSDEGGWGPPGIKPGIPISGAVDPDNEQRVFVNNYNGGNFLSVDGGVSWVNASQGYTGSDIRDIEVKPENPAMVYASGRTGIFKTVNGGREWFGISYGIAETDLNSVCVPDRQFDTLFGVVDGQMGIINSTDGGRNWQCVFIHDSANVAGEGFHRFSDIRVAPSDPRIIYTGMNHTMNIGNLDPDGLPSFGMYKSADGGSEWTEINTGLPQLARAVNTIAVHPYQAGTVYIGTCNDGIYRTTDGGASWSAVNNGLGSSDIRTIAIDPLDPDVLYAGTGNGYGIYKSIDGGELWKESNVGFQLKCPSYLSSFGRAVEGMDLDFMRPGLITQDYYNVEWTKVLDIVIDPTDTRNVYAADFSSGIHYSNDAGKTWSVINSGVSLRTATCLAISGDGTVLYAGIKGDGVLRLALENKAPQIQRTIPAYTDTVTVFRGDTALFEVIGFDLNDDSLSYLWTFGELPLEEASDSVFQLFSGDLAPGYYTLGALVSDPDTTVLVEWIVEVRELQTGLNPEAPGTFPDAAIRIFPNPFTHNVEIRYLLPCEAGVEISVYDLTGREVRDILTGYQPAGIHTLHWDGKGSRDNILPVGIYIIRFVYTATSGKLVQERKVVFSK